MTFGSLNLFELIKKNNYQGVSMSLIKKFATSMIQCLRLLFREGIIHCDLKPVSSRHTQQTTEIMFGSEANTYPPPNLRTPLLSHLMSHSGCISVHR